MISSARGLRALHNALSVNKRKTQMSTKLSQTDLALSTLIVDNVVSALTQPVNEFFRTPYDGRNVSMSDQTAVDFGNPDHKDGNHFAQGLSLTKQSFRDECDVNRIMDQFEENGVLPMPSQSPLYGDFTLLPTYHEAQNFIVQAQMDFDNLPSDLRARFDNDPAKFLEFADDPANADEMRELGLLPPLEAEAQPASTAPAGAAERPQTAGEAAPADGASAP